MLRVLQVCIWWGDGEVSRWPLASIHSCNKTALLA
jgi:hypothetical protein